MRLPFHMEGQVVPGPQREQLTRGIYAFPAVVKVRFHGVARPEDSLAWEVLRDDLRRLLKREVILADDAPSIRLVLQSGDSGESPLPEEGYSLVVDGQGVAIAGADARGLVYGVHSLVQLAGLGRYAGLEGQLEHRRLLDWPHYRFRSIMPDSGRAPLSLEMLKRLVRIASRLKLNAMHLHLHDNELNPVKYPGTPMGYENPFALELGDYAELIRYGARWQVEVFPELESWGHMGSILQHYPQLYGATRPFGIGHTIGVGPEAFRLIEGLYDAWLDILPDGSKVHVGLDEANWRLLPGADPKVYNKKNLIQLYFDSLHGRARAHKKSVTMLIWGAPSDLFIPGALRDQIIVEPYTYDIPRRDPEALLPSVKPSVRVPPYRDGAHRPFVCGAGISGTHELGGLAATESWAWNARAMPNCLGMDLCQWGSNDIAGRLVSLFGGADASWKPSPVVPGIECEMHTGQVATRMKVWQSFTPDADPGALRQAQGPEAQSGEWRWGEEAGRKILPLWMPEKPVLGDFIGPEEFDIG